MAKKTMTSDEMREALGLIVQMAQSKMLCIDERQRRLISDYAEVMGERLTKPPHSVERCTVDKQPYYHLYKSDGRYFVDYYHDEVIHSYATEAAAREAIDKHYG